MEFDATTFALEIINFLVLVWLLKRLLYQPIIAAVASRQAGIERLQLEARAIRNEAEALKGEYDCRMAAWEEERANARQLLADEMTIERSRLTAALRESLDREHERQRVIEQRRALDERARLESDARIEGGRFAGRVLSRLADADLEERIRLLLLEDLPRLPDDEIRTLRKASEPGKADVTSVYPLNEEQRSGVARALGQIAGRPIACAFAQDAELMAGLRINLGPWTIRANLQDELRFFAEAQHGRTTS